MNPGPLVVVGDSVLDIDIDGTVTRISPEAPVPVVDADRMWQRPGAAGLAATLAARGEVDVVLVTAVADDPPGRILTDLLREAGVRVIALPLAGSTVCKTRIRARGQSVVRLDHGDGTAACEPLDRSLVRTLSGARAVLVSDYGNGITSHRHLRALLATIAPHVPVVWDPHPRGSDPIPGAALVTPNEAEAQGSSAETLRERWQARAVAVTLGERGAMLTTRWAAPRHIPVPAAVLGRTASSGDTCGAGDRFAVAAAAAFGTGAGVTEAVCTAVQTAARFVAAGGAVGVSSPAALSGGPTARVEDSPVGADIDTITRRLRRRGGRLVATGGCFDLLHTGHVGLLRRARDLGDALVVLLNSDASVRRLKGPDRPIVTAEDRARVLAALACVDAVYVFDESSPADVLEQLRPDVWVKGGDYRADQLPEADVVTRYGGEVVILPTVPGYSSTKLIASAAAKATREKEVS